MRCLYINLDAAAQRRDFLEKNFAQHKGNDWTLTRIAAIDADYVDAHGVGGSSTTTEKACFLSHKKAIRESMATDEPVLILEDDAMFGESTCRIIDQLPAYGVDDEWDIIFTDVTVTDIGDMISLVRLRQEVAEKREIRIMNLKSVFFAGSISYLVNKRAKRRLYGLLESVANIDVAYDIFLRSAINLDKIAGFVFFPFITSTSELSRSSSVRHSTARADSIWDLYRKLIWIERDMEQQKPALTAMYQGLGEEERAFGVLWGAMAGRDYQTR